MARSVYRESRPNLFYVLTVGSTEKILIIASSLLLLSVLASKTASRFGIPSLLVFLGVGMLGGSEGPGGIQFHDVALTQTLAVLALCFILFSGGMGTETKTIRPILRSGLVLSTLGVVIAAFLIGWFATHFLHFSKIAGLLLGATVSSTDVAAVFTALRSKNISLKNGLKPLLEFESAVNDPMTVFLSVGLLQIYSVDHGGSLLALFPIFIRQMLLGAALGWAGAKSMTLLINRVRLEFEGLYPVLSIALVLLVYGVTQALGGSGFLALYVAGIVLGNSNFLHKKSLVQFHDGLTWLMQIAMFLAMGLIVLPHELVDVTSSGLLLSVFLIFVARPASVFVCLLPFRYSIRETLMISWAGLRGAVPIILATYPLIAGVAEARHIFNLVFFVVATSVLFQGTSIAAVARWLKVNAPFKPQFRYPIEYNPTTNLKNELVEIPIPPNSSFVGRPLVDLDLPSNTLIVLIHRNDDVLVPRGGTCIEANDMLLVLAEKETLNDLKKRIAVTV